MSPYSVYTDIAFRSPTKPKNIGIIVKFDKKDDNSICDDVQLDMKVFLQQQFPESIVRIRKKISDVDAYARLILANVSVCNPSTFCLFPAIASVGKSYLLDSTLYPFVKAISKEESNVELISTTYLRTENIVGDNMKSADVISRLRA